MRLHSRSELQTRLEAVGLYSNTVFSGGSKFLTVTNQMLEANVFALYPTRVYENEYACHTVKFKSAEDIYGLHKMPLNFTQSI